MQEEFLAFDVLKTYPWTGSDIKKDNIFNIINLDVSMANKPTINFN